MPQNKPDEPHPLSEIAKIQLQQAIETYRAQITLLAQIFAALVIGDVTMLGFAAQQHAAFLIACGAGFPFVMLLLYVVFGRLAVPVLATAISIEARYCQGGLASTFVAVGLSQEYFHILRDASVIEHESQRVPALAALPYMPFFAGGKPMFYTSIFVVILQLAAAVVLHMSHKLGF